MIVGRPNGGRRDERCSHSAALRSAVGKFGGSIAKVPAADLGAQIIKALLASTDVKPASLGGDFRTSAYRGCGQTPRARHYSPGHSKQVPAMTLGKVCGSGLKAAHLAARPSCAAMPNRHCGRPENMSASPHVFQGLARRLSHGRREARRQHDRRRPVGRVQQLSHGHDGRERRQSSRSLAASRTSSPRLAAEGGGGAKGRKVQGEIVPIEIVSRKGASPVRQSDEFIRTGPRPKRLAN